MERWRLPASQSQSPNSQWTKPADRFMVSAMRKRFGWMRLVGALLIGLLVAGLFPPFSAVGLAWVALVPVLVALWSLSGARRGWRGFGLGWLAGSASSAVQFHWLAEVSSAAAVLLPLYLGCFWGLFGAFAATLGNPWQRATPVASEPDGLEPDDAAHLHARRAERRARMLEVAPARVPGVILPSLRMAACHGAIWAGLEWLRSWLFTGFGWNGLGVAFHETLSVAQAADLLGVAGLSLLLVFFQAVMVQAGWRLLQSTRDGKRRPRWDFAVAAGVVGLVVCYGLIRAAGEDRRPAVRVKALLVQLNVPQDQAQMSWDDLAIHRAYEDDTIAALEAISQANDKALQGAMEAAPEGQLKLQWPDWVVWPESAMRGRLLRSANGSWAAYQENLNTFAAIRTAGPFSLIFGAIELEATAEGDDLLPKPNGAMYNTLAALPPDDDLQTFRKHHLVIFGETIPFMDALPVLKKIYEQQSGMEYHGSFTPGESFEPLRLQAGGREVGIIPSVCFEDTVPRLSRQFVKAGPQVIVNVTNDGWFNQSIAAAQHFANARFRAIELRRPMLRCANTGVSAAVNSAGSTAHPDTGKPQVLADACGNTFTRGTLLAELDVPLEPTITLYALIGDAGIIGLALLALGSSWLARPTRIAPAGKGKHHPNPPNHRVSGEPEPAGHER
jgi:apolipoprotein N-acyltransferase